MSKNRKGVVLTGGKTGGHIYPGLSIGDYIKDNFEDKISYIGAKDGMEERILAREKIDFYPIVLKGIVGKSFFSKIKGLVYDVLGVFKGISILKKIRPRLVIGTGGFVSGPILLGAFILRIPVIIHEQNVYPGLTNKLVSKFALEVWITFEESKKYFKNQKKIHIVGMPIRKNIESSLVRKESNKLVKSKKIFLVVGGSQGSRFLNNTILDNYEYIIERGYKIIHITGESLKDEVISAMTLEMKALVKKGSWEIKGYCHNMNEVLINSDMIISRSGASFISEIIYMKKKSIQIPLKAAARGHQYYNGMYVENCGLGKVLIEDDVNKVNFIKTFEFVEKIDSNLIDISDKIMIGDDTRKIILERLNLNLR